ncbi:MAG: NADH-quinone oxidoreductase subunit NuoK [Planctomycetaceae bacterium]|nr:NADH-quinone oxidoreductase subunit NuoK [Planctomycetaceae bacterium]
MEELFTPTKVLILSGALMSIGVYGVLARRNLIVMLMSLEMMLVAVNVVLVLFSRMHASEGMAGHVSQHTYEAAFLGAHTGQIFTLMIMTVAAGEVGVGLAILVALYRSRNSIDVDQARELRL